MTVCGHHPPSASSWTLLCVGRRLEQAQGATAGRSAFTSKGHNRQRRSLFPFTRWEAQGQGRMSSLRVRLESHIPLPTQSRRDHPPPLLSHKEVYPNRSAEKHFLTHNKMDVLN